MMVILIHSLVLAGMCVVAATCLTNDLKADG